MPRRSSAYDAAVTRDVALADAALEGKIRRAKDDPRARIRLVAEGPGKDAKEADEPKPQVGEVEKPTITFADVGGLDELKEKVRLRVLYPLKRPDLYKAFGKKVGGGLLLYGPPGCGKTFLARATAGEAGIHFVAVGIEEVLDMWLGQSEKKLHELFKTARAKAPAILFFDEVDSLGGRRSGLRHESYRTLVTQFLSELDGAGGQSEGVLVIGATNAPWDVDPAFRRPGRFGEVLFVPPPDLRARVEILKLKLAGKPVAADIDVAEIARATELSLGRRSRPCRAVGDRDGARRVAARRRDRATSRPTICARRPRRCVRRRSSGSRPRRTSPPTPTSRASSTKCSTI